MKKTSIKKACDKAVELMMREMVIQTIADDSIFWEFEFDRNEYNVPNNWDEMTLEEKAEYVYENTAWDLEDWLEYYQYESE